MEAGPGADHDRWARLDLDVDHERAKVIAHRAVALGPSAREVASQKESACRPGELRGIHRGADLEPVIRGGDTPCERRSGQPDVDQLHEAPAWGQPVRQRLAHPPGGPSLAEDDIDELALGGHADRQRRAEGDPRPWSITLRPCERQAGGLDGGGPCVGDVPLAGARRHGITCHDEPPALAGLARLGGVGHVC
jgi:hypothetical protein